MSALSDFADFVKNSVDPSKSAGDQEGTLNPGNSAVPATAAAFPVALAPAAPAIGAVATRVAVAGLGVVAGPASAFAAEALILGVPIAVGIVAGAGLISSANEHADPIDDEGKNEGGVPTERPDAPPSGGVPTERPVVDPFGRPVPQTPTEPRPPTPTFPADPLDPRFPQVPPPPLLPTIPESPPVLPLPPGGSFPQAPAVVAPGGATPGPSGAGDDGLDAGAT